MEAPVWTGWIEMGVQKPFAHNGNKTCLLKNVHVTRGKKRHF